MTRKTVLPYWFLPTGIVRKYPNRESAAVADQVDSRFLLGRRFWFRLYLWRTLFQSSGSREQGSGATQWPGSISTGVRSAPTVSG